MPERTLKKNARTVLRDESGQADSRILLAAKIEEDQFGKLWRIVKAFPQTGAEFKILRRTKSKVGKLPDGEHCEEDQRRERDREEMEHEQEAQTANR